MKLKLNRYIITAILFLTSAVCSFAQINLNFLDKIENTHIRIKVKDQETREAIGFATAYLTPKGDTTIVDFCLSDQEGNIRFKELPVGKYEVNVEMMGYLPYKKVHECKEWEVDLGEIFLEINQEFIESARVSAVGNPIRIVKDTIEFTASAFRVGQNAMLEDLLKKMPGMEIEDGVVKLNGQAIDRITVGGKTFFFNDQSAALKNLPARIIDKIKVIDQKKEDVMAGSARKPENREKVMDVALKEEFKKGWFGNMAASGGVSINSDKENELMEKSKMLYNGNAMVSGYNEKDQVVFIANGENVPDPDARQVFIASNRSSMQEMDEFSKLGGLSTTASSGINWTTDRSKKLDIATSAKYNYTYRDDKRKSYRTSYQIDAPDLNSESTFNGHGHQNGVNVNLEMKRKRNDKVYFKFEPYISYTNSASHQNSWSETLQNGEQKSKNSTLTQGNSSIFTAGLNSRFGLLNLGKEGRMLQIGVDALFGNGDGKSKENTSLSGQIKNLNYVADQQEWLVSGMIGYREPIAEKWNLVTTLVSTFNNNDKVKDAFNMDGGKNDGYSTFSRNRYLQERLSLGFNYENERGDLNFGAEAMATQNDIHTRSLGQETESGKGRWDWNFGPTVGYYTSMKGHRFGINVNCSSSPVSSELVTPALDFKDPLQIRTGNVYLKPFFRNQLFMNYAYNNPKTFTYLSLDVQGFLNMNGISNAIWFDENGSRYAVPVNVRKPQHNVDLYFNFNQPFGPKRHFTFSAYCNTGFARTNSYQATSVLEGMDLDKFDYKSFMTSFWGNENGDRFYSGESGFAESNTQHFHMNGNVKLKYTNDVVDVSVRQYATHNNSRYSLNSAANVRTWSFTSRLDLAFFLGKEWEIGTDVAYIWYRGYAEGYGEPMLGWNMKVSKSVKAFTFTLRAIDLLNQSRNLRHTISQEYVEDAYVNAIGRFITFGIAWNFGKKGAVQNNRVRNAIFQMQ